MEMGLDRMKEKRQAAILRIVREQAVETQQQLAQRLREEGIEVTQATVSRDIKELRLVKILTGDGRYRYSAPPNRNAGDEWQRACRAFREYVIGQVWTGNLIILQCLSGTAPAISQALDDLHWPEVVATLAGDNVVLVILRSREDAVTPGDEPDWEPMRSTYRRLQQMREGQATPPLSTSAH